MGWHARLALDYAQEGGRTVARFAHEGPLRILQSLYPEGDATCHNVLVHPPGGLVGGDTLDLKVTAAAGAHGLITTPGAARFYRSEGPAAVQRTQIEAAEGARLEWVPMETLYYPACVAENHLTMALAPGAELLGWDVAALGLPHAGKPFLQGKVLQHFALGDAWLERGRIDAADIRLMDGPLGLAGHRCVATLFFCTGSDLSRQRREAVLDAARAVLDAHPQLAAGATSPHPRVVVVRVLAGLVEPAMDLLKATRLAWRTTLWNLSAAQPRGWSI